MKPILLALLLLATSCHTPKPITSAEMSEIFGGARVIKDGDEWYISTKEHDFYMVFKSRRHGYVVWYVTDGVDFENNKQAIVFQGRLNLKKAKQ